MATQVLNSHANELRVHRKNEIVGSKRDETTQGFRIFRKSRNDKGTKRGPNKRTLNKVQSVMATA